MTLDAATAQDYVETLLRHFPAKLTGWEDGFVRSLQRQLAEGRVPSEKQSRVLDDLMERVAQGYGR